MNRLRLFIAFLGFVFGFCVIGYTEIRLRDLAYWLLGRSRAERRHAITRAGARWGARVTRFASAVTNIAIHLDLPERVEGPLVIIANHVNSFDIALMELVFHTLDITNVRWIVKSEAKRWPVIGWMATHTGCAFVDRARGSDDLERVRESALLAKQDQASFFLFPEGTRYKKAKAVPTYKHLLPPKRAGFDLVTRCLPESPVLSIMFRFDPPINTESRTMPELYSLCGKRLLIRGRLTSAREVAQNPHWLTHEWERMDKELSRHRSS